MTDLRPRDCVTPPTPKTFDFSSLLEKGLKRQVELLGFASNLISCELNACWLIPLYLLLIFTGRFLWCGLTLDNVSFILCILIFFCTIRMILFVLQRSGSTELMKSQYRIEECSTATYPTETIDCARNRAVPPFTDPCTPFESFLKCYLKNGFWNFSEIIADIDSTILRSGLSLRALHLKIFLHFLNNEWQHCIFAIGFVINIKPDQKLIKMQQLCLKHLILEFELDEGVWFMPKKHIVRQSDRENSHIRDFQYSIVYEMMALQFVGEELLFLMGLVPRSWPLQEILSCAKNRLSIHQTEGNADSAHHNGTISDKNERIN